MVDQDETRVRRRVVIGGRVQGVGFRQACADAARGRTVAGWVRNRRDGTVEAVFEGPAAAVETMVGWCRSGPLAARVERVEVNAEEPDPEHTQGFRIGTSS